MNKKSDEIPIDPIIKTGLGSAIVGDSLELMKKKKAHSVDLIVTSPPYGLLTEKSYGNVSHEQYLNWFKPFATEFKRIMRRHASLVIDIGGTWKRQLPARSLYHFELLIMLCKEFGFELVQEFYSWNPAKLPTPAEWVTIRRIRVKDAINCVWWLSKTPYPKAANERVLQPYSSSMRKLLKKGYIPNLRPSGHDISDKFQKDNQGSIPSNLLAIANTESNSNYLKYCRDKGLKPNPSRFPLLLPAFFIKLLTNKFDVVLDPFAGSCVTGQAAEILNRKWICMELESEYVKGAKSRFTDDALKRASLQLHKKKQHKIFRPLSLKIKETSIKLKTGRKRGRKQ